MDLVELESVLAVHSELSLLAAAQSYICELMLGVGGQLEGVLAAHSELSLLAAAQSYAC